MFCGNCGNQLREGAKFCPKCGKQVKRDSNITLVINQEQPVVLEHMPEFENGEKNKKKNKILFFILIGIIFVAVIVITGAIYITTEKEEIKGCNLFSRKENSFDAVVENSWENTEDLEDTEVAEATEDIRATEASGEEESILQQKEALPVVLDDDSGDPDTIHTYRIVMADVSWTDAFIASKNIPNGYLVHINSEEEMNVILDQIAAEGQSNGIFWIGASRDSADTEYFWVDADGNKVGECLNTSEYWLSGEPTWSDEDSGAMEDSVMMFYAGKEERWVWNDTVNNLLQQIPSYAGKLGYIIEIEN